MRRLLFGSLLLFALACGDDGSSDSGVDASQDAIVSDVAPDAVASDAVAADADGTDAGECVAEGDTTPVIPNAPPCCTGLVPVGCSAPGPDGMCAVCAGASFCTFCGDGECGLGENVCRCPADCS